MSEVEFLGNGLRAGKLQTGYEVEVLAGDTHGTGGQKGGICGGDAAYSVLRLQLTPQEDLGLGWPFRVA